MAIPVNEHRNLVSGYNESVKNVFSKIEGGDAIHGLTDGTWDVSDAIFEILEKTGPIELLTISTWTAARADIKSAYALLKTDKIKNIRFLVDRSFLTRHPDYCKELLQSFGKNSVRAWNNHAKFVIFEGGDSFNALYLTSANLNKNRRIENYSLFCGGSLPGEYIKLVNGMFAVQKSGEAFDKPSVARSHTQTIFEDLQKEHPAPKLVVRKSFGFR